MAHRKSPERRWIHTWRSTNRSLSHQPQLVTPEAAFASPLCRGSRWGPGALASGTRYGIENDEMSNESGSENAMGGYGKERL